MPWFLKMEMDIIWIYVSYRECPLMGLNDYYSTILKVKGYLLLLCLQFSLSPLFLAMHTYMHIHTQILLLYIVSYSFNYDSENYDKIYYNFRQYTLKCTNIRHAILTSGHNGVCQIFIMTQQFYFAS